MKKQQILKYFLQYWKFVTIKKINFKKLKTKLNMIKSVIFIIDLVKRIKIIKFERLIKY